MAQVMARTLTILTTTRKTPYPSIPKRNSPPRLMRLRLSEYPLTTNLTDLLLLRSARAGKVSCISIIGICVCIEDLELLIVAIKS